MEHVGEDGSEVEIAGSGQVGAGEGGAASAHDGSDVVAAEKARADAARRGPIDSASGVDDGGQIAVAEFGVRGAVIAEDGCDIKVARPGEGLRYSETAAGPELFSALQPLV